MRIMSRCRRQLRAQMEDWMAVAGAGALAVLGTLRACDDDHSLSSLLFGAASGQRVSPEAPYLLSCSVSVYVLRLDNILIRFLRYRRYEII